MNFNETNCLRGLNNILNSLNLINLPSSLWGIHIHPKYEYVAVVQVSYTATTATLAIDKAIVLQYDDITAKIQANIFIHCKSVTLPQVSPIVTSMNDLCSLIFSVHELKICNNWQREINKNADCLIYASPGFDRCVMCNADDKQKFISYDFQKSNAPKLCSSPQLDSSETAWQTECTNDVQLNESLSADSLMGSSEDVDVVVKQILELEYTNQSTHQEYNEEPIPAAAKVDLEPDSDHSIQFNRSGLENTARLKCNTCSKDFANHNTLMRHERTHSKTVDKETERIKCSLCPKDFANLTTLRRHERVHNNGATTTTTIVHNCRVCGKVFANVSRLKVHESRVHGGTESRRFLCEWCNRRFHTASHLTEHRRLHTNERPFRCGECGRTDTHRAAHRRHVAGHQTNKQSEPPGQLCTICGKTLCRGYRLEEHLATHSTARPHLCGVCGKGFARAAGLRLHARTHVVPAQRFECSVCGRRYSTRSNLNTHVKARHADVRPHECGACGARFVHPRLLRLHQRRHTGERPYRCSRCGRAFARRAHLTVHERTHSGMRPYRCEHCDKGFTTSGNLAAHRRVHHQQQIGSTVDATVQQTLPF